MPNAMVDASIPLNVQQPQIMNYGDLMKYKYGMQLQQMQMDEMQRQMQSRNAMTGALSQPGAFTPQGDISPEAFQRLQQTNPAAAIEMRNQMLINEEKRAQIARAQAQEQEAQQKIAAERRQQYMTKLAPVTQTLVSRYDDLVKKIDPAQAIQKIEEEKAKTIDEMEQSGELTKQEADQARKSKFDPARARVALLMVKGAGTGTGPTAELVRAKSQLAQGVISQEEYDAIVAKETGGGQSAFAKEMKDAGIKPGSPEWNRNWQKRIAKETSPTATMINLGGAGGAAPKLQLDEAGSKALDMQAWNYINKGTLPYRKGMGGGRDRNDAIVRRAGEIANDLGMSAEELSAKSADFKSNAASLAFSTKKLDAIQGVLESFHNNVETWDSIAKGVAPKLGGARVEEFKKDLRKIDFTGIKSLDEVKLKIQQQFNDPTVAAYLVATMSVAMDYARIMQGPQSAAALTESARKDAERLISAGANDKARKGVIAALDSDTAGQVKGLEDQTNKIRKRLGMRGGSEPEKKPAAGSHPKDIQDLLGKY